MLNLRRPVGITGGDIGQAHLQKNFPMVSLSGGRVINETMTIAAAEAAKITATGITPLMPMV